MTELDGTGSIKPASAALSATVAKDDVVVVAELGGTYYVEIVEAVETYATKLNAKAGKVTLADGGEVVFAADKLTVAGAKAQNITTAQLGSTKKTGYYVYNGEIILADDIKTASDYSIAILKEITKSEDEEVNPETYEYTTSYKAVLIVDGKDVEVTLATDKAIIDGENTITAADAYNTYKKGVTAGKKVDYNYALVASYDEEDGVYTLTMNSALNDGDVVVANGVLSYNATTGLYTVKNDDVTYNKVILDDNSKIFYTYTKKATGDFEYIANYTKETITTKKFSANAIAAIYLTTADEGKTYTLLATVVENEIEGSADDKINYENDGTLILYAPENSETIFDETDEKNYYLYSFMDNETLTNKEATVDKTKAADDDKDAATETVSGNFYAWDEDLDEYVHISAEDNLDSFKYVTLTSVVDANGNTLLELGDSTMIKINDDITIWGLDATEEETNDTYVTFTVAELGDMLDLVAEYNEENKDVEGFKALVVNAILVQVEDAKGEFALDTVIVEVFEENEDEEVESINGIIFSERV
jgi:hypothetical protein